MFKNINPSDFSVKPYVTHKSFTVTDSDSGSGVFGMSAVSSSGYAFDTVTATKTSFGTDVYPYSKSFFSIPTYFQIRHNYYGGTTGTTSPYQNFCFHSESKRNIGTQCTVITIPQKLFGEKVHPKSIKLLDDSTSATFDIRDDGRGNLYDFAFSSSYAANSASAINSGSVIGNIFYEHGVMVFTDTGSYQYVGTGKGSDGYQLTFQATHTNYEYEIVANVNEGEYNSSTNISVTKDRSGSMQLTEGTPNMHSMLPFGDNPTNGTASLQSFYNATEEVESFVTHSEFRPYITTIGLYNDKTELMAVGKLSRAIKNDGEFGLKFVVRFDV